ncbi:MAG: hypothetical protein HFH96_04340 [Lachnospiraceae bacterium]|jgi:hypothetical protein|nr:hypothetical protein [uncultured Acetatifactor sp.]MCI9230332.1 hypothetical protein [Lachnospiraceae bacterium]
MKSYLVFTSAWYRLAVFLLMPIALIGLGLWVERMLWGGRGATGVIVAAVLLPMVEIVSDNWLFGGIQTKDSMRLEYLKTSGRGMDILRAALWMDLLRKFLAALGIMALCRLAGTWMAMAEGTDYGFDIMDWGLEAGILLYFTLLSYFVSTLGTFLSRFGDMLWMNLLVGYGAVFVMLFGLALLNLADIIFIIDIICAVFGILISAVTVRAATKRVERSYYD